MHSQVSQAAMRNPDFCAWRKSKEGMDVHRYHRWRGSRKHRSAQQRIRWRLVLARSQCLGIYFMITSGTETFWSGRVSTHAAVCYQTSVIVGLRRPVSHSLTGRHSDNEITTLHLSRRRRIGYILYHYLLAVALQIYGVT